MIIELTKEDWRDEFVFWRNYGQTKIAFDYLRVRQTDLEYFEILVAMIGKRKYGRDVNPGDVICLGDIKVEWTQQIDDEFYGTTFPVIMRTLILNSVHKGLNIW
jgi:hypothetical protein